MNQLSVQEEQSSYYCTLYHQLAAHWIYVAKLQLQISLSLQRCAKQTSRVTVYGKNWQNGKGKDVPAQAMMSCAGEKIYTSTPWHLITRSWSASRPSRFTPGKGAPNNH
jgi:hypothetical protein